MQWDLCLFSFSCINVWHGCFQEQRYWRSFQWRLWRAEDTTDSTGDVCSKPTQRGSLKCTGAEPRPWHLEISLLIWMGTGTGSGVARGRPRRRCRNRHTGSWEGWKTREKEKTLSPWGQDCTSCRRRSSKVALHYVLPCLLLAPKTALWGQLPGCHLVSWTSIEVLNRQEQWAEAGAVLTAYVTRWLWLCAGSRRSELQSLMFQSLGFLQQLQDFVSCLKFSCIWLQTNSVFSYIQNKHPQITLPSTCHPLEQTSCLYLSFQHQEWWIFI